MKRSAKLVSVACVVLFLLVLAAGLAAPQERTQWVSELCVTNSCVAEKLNSLSPDRAHDAKLTTWKNFTYIWYRK